MRPPGLPAYGSCCIVMLTVTSHSCLGPAGQQPGRGAAKGRHSSSSSSRLRCAVRRLSLEALAGLTGDSHADLSSTEAGQERGSGGAARAAVAAEDAVLLMHDSGSIHAAAWPLPTPASSALDVSAVGVRVTLFGPGAASLMSCFCTPISRMHACCERTPPLCFSSPRACSPFGTELYLSVQAVNSSEQTKPEGQSGAGLPFRGAPLLLPADVHVSLARMAGSLAVHVTTPCLYAQLPLPGLHALQVLGHEFAAAQARDYLRHELLRCCMRPMQPCHNRVSCLLAAGWSCAGSATCSRGAGQPIR